MGKVHVCASCLTARVERLLDRSVAPKRPLRSSRSARWVCLLFDDSVVAVLRVAGRFHFLTNGAHLLTDVLDALEEGPTE